jgi:NAD+ diphosphatase
MNNNNNVKALWFVFHNDQLLLEKDNDKLFIPFQETSPLPSSHSHHAIAKMDNTPCIAYYIDDIPNSDKYSLVPLRESFDFIERNYYDMAGKAFEILYWDMNTQYCPACGTKTETSTTISKICPKCGKEIFTRVTPAILVRIHKDDKIMLVHSRTFKHNFKGLVAGFVETGESLEDCVRREVMEETSLKIKNINYFGSQPWPYPSNIMIGYTADYDSGEVKLQEEELTSGDFFERNNLPPLPRKDSLARRMIDDWINNQ